MNQWLLVVFLACLLSAALLMWGVSPRNCRGRTKINRWLPPIILACLLSATLVVWGASAARHAAHYETAVLTIERSLIRAIRCTRRAIAADDPEERRKYVLGVYPAASLARVMLRDLRSYNWMDAELAGGVTVASNNIWLMSDDPTDQYLDQILSNTKDLLDLITAAKVNGRIDRGKLTRSLRSLSY